MISEGAYSLDFHVFDPLDGLSLWIHHQWPSGTSCHHHSVFSRELVSRQALEQQKCNNIYADSIVSADNFKNTKKGGKEIQNSDYAT